MTVEADKIDAIEREIRKIELQLKNLGKGTADRKSNTDIHLATKALLKQVIKALKKQQQKLMQLKTQ